MEIIKTESIDGKAIKYSVNGMEFISIRKKDGKNNLCIPTQTFCNLKCQFCQLTYLPKQIPSNLDCHFIYSGVKRMLADLPYEPTLLLSFMGRGEPLLCQSNLFETITYLQKMICKSRYENMRFAIATIIPSQKHMELFTDSVVKNNLPMKVHWSLHSPDQEIRSELIPAALNISDSMDLIKNYIKKTSNPVEIHYALTDSVNDKREDALKLADLIKDIDNISVKIMTLSDVPKSGLRPSNRAEDFALHLTENGVKEVEIYTPPGQDIGASCGLFNV